MNFIAGLLLLASGFEEHEAFSLFCFLMLNLHLKDFFREHFPLLRRYVKGKYNIYNII